MVVLKTAQEFSELIKGENILVNFTAEWSGPAKMMDMVFEEVESDLDGFTLVKVDSDRFRSIAKDYQVVNVPVICLFANGKVVKKQNGFMRKEELLSFINN